MTKDSEKEKLAYEYMEEGRQTFYDNKLNQAALLVQNAMHLFKDAGNMRMYAMSLNLMGVIYSALGNEGMSIDYYLEGLECAIDRHYDDITTLFYNNIGSRYHELKEFEKAIVYFLKAEQELEHEETKKAERYRSWCMVTYLNLLNSYGQLDQYEEAEKYLLKARMYAEDKENQIYMFGIRTTECRLYWAMGKKDYVYENLDALVEGALNDKNTSDYVQDMLDICDLLKKMGEYEKWKQVILSYEKYATEQLSIYFQLVLTEMWMDYYKAIDDMNKYIHLCVDHAELYRKQKEINDKERAAVIDIKIELQEKEAARKRAEQKSNTDLLTGLGNRYALRQEAERLIKEAGRTKQHIGVGVLDIDCFKQKNDTYGHIEGDECLRQIGKILLESVKGVGHAYRFGGDEFVILMHDGNEQGIKTLAEKIKHELHALQIENINSLVLPVLTISQGYASFVPEEDTNDEKLLIHADKALYEAKKAGKNGYYIITEKEKKE